MKNADNRDSLEDEPIPVPNPTTYLFLLWLRRKKTVLLVILSVLLALFLIILSFTWNRKEQKIEEVKTAHMLVGSLQKEPLFTDTAEQKEHDVVHRADTIKKLAAIVKREPELQKEFSGVIAQELIIDKEKNLSPWAGLAEKTLSTLYSPEYADFSKVSAERTIEDGYKSASKLRLELEKDDKALALSRPSLYIYTLLQIASSAKLLNQKNEKEEALTALKTFIRASLEERNTLSTKESIKRITAHFQENKESLTEFIEQF